MSDKDMQKKKKRQESQNGSRTQTTIPFWMKIGHENDI